MSSELPQPMPAIEWHFMDEHPLRYGRTGYILFHDLTGSEQPIAHIRIFPWRGPNEVPALEGPLDEVGSHVYLLTRPPGREPKLTQAEWTEVVAEVVATVCSILHEPFFPQPPLIDPTFARRAMEDRRYELQKTFGRVTARSGF